MNREQRRFKSKYFKSHPFIKIPESVTNEILGEDKELILTELINSNILQMNENGEVRILEEISFVEYIKGLQNGKL